VAEHPYRNQRLALATIHGKDRAIAAPFWRVLRAEIVVAESLDTDALGTFSGEIPRPGPLVETCLQKTQLAFSSLDVDCALASEGSYGPIDAVPLVPSGMEIMAFVDRRRGVKLVETLLTHRTNWRLYRFKAGDPAVPAALKEIGFPHFGAFVMRNSDFNGARKDLATVEQAVDAVNREATRSADGLALVISDMRAHRNPLRMRVLRALGWKLAKRLQSLCPKCHAPGFGPIESRRGLACEDCGSPTHWIDFEIDGCGVCGHATTRPRKDGRSAAPRLACTACREQRPHRKASGS
jgi:hypothetical protein